MITLKSESLTWLYSFYRILFLLCLGQSRELSTGKISGTLHVCAAKLSFQILKCCTVRSVTDM